MAHSSNVASEALPEESSPRKRLTGLHGALLAGVILVAVIIGVLVSQYSPSQISPVTPPPPSKAWHVVSSYSGDSDLTTPSFPITGERFALNWSYDAQLPQYLVFSMDVYSKSGDLIDAMCITGSYAHDSYPSCGLVVDSSNGGNRVNGGPGSFFVQVQAVNLEWKIIVQDYY